MARRTSPPTPSELRVLESAPTSSTAPAWRPARGQVEAALALAARGLLAPDGDGYALTPAGMRERRKHPAREPGELRTDAPVDDLLAEAGLHYVDLAARCKVSPQSIIGDRKRGGGISVATLAKRCEAAGMRLVMRVERVK